MDWLENLEDKMGSRTVMALRVALAFLCIGIFAVFCFFAVASLIVAVSADIRYLWWVFLCIIGGTASMFGIVYFVED